MPWTTTSRTLTKTTIRRRSTCPPRRRRLQRRSVATPRRRRPRPGGRRRRRRTVRRRTREPSSRPRPRPRPRSISRGIRRSRTRTWISTPRRPSARPSFRPSATSTTSVPATGRGSEGGHMVLTSRNFHSPTVERHIRRLKRQDRPAPVFTRKEVENGTEHPEEHQETVGRGGRRYILRSRHHHPHQPRVLHPQRCGGGAAGRFRHRGRDRGVGLVFPRRG